MVTTRKAAKKKVDPKIKAATKRKAAKKKVASKRKASPNKKSRKIIAKMPQGGHQLWNMTRPTRRLKSIELAMPAFKKVADGEKWDNDRQVAFENELIREGSKTDGKTRSDSGGKRTWAVLPKIFGLWYEHEDKVVITSAGEFVVEGGSQAIEQMRYQLLRFQWPNRVQEDKKQLMNEKFRIFPYRFLIKLILDKRI